jgi:hypothetical protein
MPEKVLQKRKVAVFLINSPDGTSVLNRQEAEEMVWTDPFRKSARTRYLLASYGILDFVRDGNGDGEADIFGPYETEWLADGECHYTERGRQVHNAALVTNPELADYDHFIHILPWVDPTPDGPRHINGCRFGGMGSVGGKTTWINFPSVTIIIHELGHNLFLHPVKDPTDLMSTSRTVGLNAPHLIKLGLLPESSVVETGERRRHRFVLLPVSVDPYVLPGPRVVKIRVENGDPYYVSYRDDSGVDAHLKPEDQFKTYIHRWDGGRHLEYVGTLKHRESFEDEENGLKIKVKELRWGTAVWGVKVYTTQL